MDCLSCQKCENFKKYSWGYRCVNCRCPNYLHSSYVQIQMYGENKLNNWTDKIASTSISQLEDYKRAMEMAKDKKLIWLPIGLKENKVMDFIDTFDTQLGLLDNNSNKLRRAKSIAFQIPAGDCNVCITTANADPISESEYNFKIFRDTNYFGFGELEGVDCKETCYKCQKLYVDGDQFCIRITHSGTISWHVSCFQCCQCQESQADFHYYWSQGRNNIYCMRHFDEMDYNRCGSCDELIFNVNSTKAKDKDYHVEHFTCNECNEAMTNGTFILKEDNPVCQKCYENNFANVCDRCGTKISCNSKDLSFENRHWHEKCFYCDLCKKSLADQKFSPKDTEVYCSNCYDENFALRCKACDEPFRENSKRIDYGGKPLHSQCFICQDCKQVIGSKSFVPKDGNVICVPCYEAKYCLRCSKCKEFIKSGGVTYKGEPWHKQCFLCTKCNKELANTKFTTTDSKPYCQECFTELFSKRCKNCQKAISGFGGCKYVSEGDDHWHSECFNCSKCMISLIGKGFVTRNQTILCPRCGLLKSDS